VKAKVICKTEGCKNEGKVINTVTWPGDDEEATETFYEAYGQGGEEKADFCKKCKQLGTLQDPIDDKFSSFETTCPYCKVDGRLRVVHFKCNTSIPLRQDGFATTDAQYFETTDEIVTCEVCRKEFSLSEVTL
jgi:hypothetical protein